MKGTKVLLAIVVLLCLGLGHFVYNTNIEVKQMRVENAVLSNKLDSLQYLMLEIDKKVDKKMTQKAKPAKSSVETFFDALMVEAEKEQRAKAQEKVSVSTSYRMEDRYVSGQIYKPELVGDKEGKVIIEVSIGRLGDVSKARLGEVNSITDEEVIESCKKAALRTSFNYQSEAPDNQIGTITYTFTKK